MAVALRLSVNSSSSCCCSTSSLSLSYPSLYTSTQLSLLPKQNSDRRLCSSSSPTAAAAAYGGPFSIKLRKRSWKIQATGTESNEPKWWERNTATNMIDIHSTQDFLNALSEAGEKLVIADFYGTWCGSCKALFPKLCKTAKEHPDILFLKVDFDKNKPMCKSLNVKVLPFFQFYRGADGQLDSFSCSLAKFQKLRDAIAKHNTARCSIGPPKGVGDVNLTDSRPDTQDKTAEISSG